MSCMTLFSCAPYARLNVYYSLNGNREVDKIKIIAKEYQNYILFTKERDLIDKDSTLMDPIPVDRFKKMIYHKMGIYPEPFPSNNE